MIQSNAKTKLATGAILVLQVQCALWVWSIYVAQMLPWFRLTGNLVAAILVLQIRDFCGLIFASDA